MRKFGLITDLLGSDQLIILDGRWNKTTIRRKVWEQVNRLKKVHPNHNMNKINICYGRISNPTIMWTIHI